MIFLPWPQWPFMVVGSFILVAVAVVLLCGGLLSAIKKGACKNTVCLSPPRPVPAVHPVTIVTSQDIKAIAGEDVIATQLDLARAYLELGKQKLAKQVLDHVLQKGTIDQQELAKNLILRLSCLTSLS